MRLLDAFSVSKSLVQNQIVIITLKSGARHEGTVVGTISEGDAAGVTLKDSRDVSNPASTVRESFVIPASNILSWSPRATNGTDGQLFHNNDRRVYVAQFRLYFQDSERTQILATPMGRLLPESANCSSGSQTPPLQLQLPLQAWQRWVTRRHLDQQDTAVFHGISSRQTNSYSA